MSKYTDDLYEAFGLVNAYQLAGRYECPVIYFDTQHAHAIGTRDHRSQVTFFKDGARWKSREIRTSRGGTLAESRKAHLEVAIKWAREHGLGVESWVPSGFRDTWIPEDVKDRLMAELKDWRKARRGHQHKTEKEES